MKTLATTRFRKLSLLSVLTAAILMPALAHARPAYFEQFTSHYGFVDGDRLYACGVCHYKWTGTGARNPYGTTVEQQLYLGKSILQAIQDAEPLDPDGDGYTSGDEIINWMTLPGYNCSNYTSAIGAPTGYDEYITPNVPTCLEPLDIRVSPETTAALITVGEVRTMQITVFNNGSTDQLDISSLGLLAGAPASLTITAAPTAPFSIPVGESVTIDITFAPLAPVFANTALRIVSNDPDEGTLDVPITVLAQPDPTAPGAQRGPCLAAIAKASGKYAKTQLKQWSDCYLEELSGRACDTGARDLKLGKALSKLEAVIGGSKDKVCAAAGLTPATLGLASDCAPGCESISVTGMVDVPECLACVEDHVMNDLLRDGAGTSPPDLPPNVITDPGALACQEKILGSMQKTIVKMYGALSECELAAIFADGTEGACETTIADSLTALRTSLDAVVDKCTSTTDLLGCRFEGMSPDPACLGTTSENLASDLTNASLGISTP